MSAPVFTSPEAAPTNGDRRDALSHIVCCADEDVALCGRRGFGAPCDGTEHQCLVCNDLDLTGHCPTGRACEYKLPGKDDHA